MKFICSRQNLSKALNTVSKAVSIRTTIPILKGILISAESNGNLKLMASDMDLSIEKTIEADIVEQGSVVVFAKLFTDIIRKLPEEPITVSVKEGNVNIKSNNSEFNLVALSADDFPEIGEIVNVEDKLSFDKEILKEMIRKTAFSASIDETKGIICGVLLELEKEKMNMVALDGFRMAVVREPMKNKEEKNIILYYKIVNDLYKLLSEAETEEEVTLILGDKKAVILMDKTRIFVRIMEGNYIKYRDILPKNGNTRIVVGKSEILEAIERASLLAKEGKNNLIKCNITENLLTITSSSEEGTVKEEIIMGKSGEDLEIGFNSKYISEALKVIDVDSLAMEFNSPVTPCLIKPITGDYFEYLVLPVRIPSN